MASPQDVRVATIVAVPGSIAVNFAVTVPHPPPGTHPCSCGCTTGSPSIRSAPGFELLCTVQYVLFSTSVTRSPTASVTVLLLSVSVSFVLPDAAGTDVVVVDGTGLVGGANVVDVAVVGAGLAARDALEPHAVVSAKAMMIRLFVWIH